MEGLFFLDDYESTLGTHFQNFNDSNWLLRVMFKNPVGYESTLATNLQNYPTTLNLLLRLFFMSYVLNRLIRRLTRIRTTTEPASHGFALKKVCICKNNLMVWTDFPANIVILWWMMWMLWCRTNILKLVELGFLLWGTAHICENTLIIRWKRWKRWKRKGESPCSHATTHRVPHSRVT